MQFIQVLVTLLPLLRLYVNGDSTEDASYIESEVHVNLGYVMNRGEITQDSKKFVENQLQVLDNELEDENIDEMEDDFNGSIKDNTDDDGKSDEMDDRTKSVLGNKTRNLWPKCVIPYTLDNSTLTNELISSIKSAIALYEYWTCLRFVPWQPSTGQDLGLGHDNHLHFLKKSGCWSHVGMINAGAAGQNISCCHGVSCVHEIGHSLGFIHEQQNPNRDDYIRVNYDEIKSDYIFAFIKRKSKRRKPFKWQYDLTSVMHYGVNAFNKNKRPTITMLDPHTTYLAGERDSNYYYFLREVQELYKCKEQKCPNFNTTCANDGYVVYREGHCECRCIAGLDTRTFCTSLQVVAPTLQNISWPKDGFSLPKVKRVPCPRGSRRGIIKRYGYGLTSDIFEVDGNVGNKSSTLKFCTFKKKVRNSENETWPPGEYCISRAGGSCPEGFQGGFIQYDDRRPPVTIGAVPDGRYDNDTRLEFCCRKDGNIMNPIELPVKRPFILWNNNKKRCQKVKGTFSSTQYFEFVNQDKRNTHLGKPVPVSYKRYRKIGVYVCVYRPFTADCGDIISLTEQEPVQNILSPNYPLSYPQHKVCNWIIKSPSNYKIVLSFAAFEIPSNKTDPDECQDKVEIRSFLPGQPGVSYCGSGFKASIVSQTHILSIILHSTLPQDRSKYFNATVRLSRADTDMCYSQEDKGVTYRGQVSFTHDYHKCLPWKDVTHCPHHMFEEGDRFAGLEKNYCRRPGHGDRPWCYIAADGCIRDFCDVCGIGNCHDTIENCSEALAADRLFCKRERHINSDGVIGCARTCGLCDTQSNLSVTTLRCGRPITPPDAIPVESMKQSYNVGENVYFQCSTGPNIRKMTCLTDGSWEGQGSVCQVCPDDWRILGNSCYKYFPTLVKEEDANKQCGNLTGQITTVKSVQERDLIYKLVLTDINNIWLGLSDKLNEGEYLWNDGTNLDLQVSGLSWKGNNTENKTARNCVILKRSRFMVASACNTKAAFICKVPFTYPTTCRDERDDCGVLLSRNRQLCTDYWWYAVRVCAHTCRVCA